MSKKDRIAIVVSILYFLLPLAVLLDGGYDAPIAALVLTSLLIVYWSYRFVKNDISFVKSSELGIFISRKDRIAIVVSILYFLLPLVFLLGERYNLTLVYTLPLIIYWGYRFIKDDISFVKISEKEVCLDNKVLSQTTEEITMGTIENSRIGFRWWVVWGWLGLTIGNLYTLGIMQNMPGVAIAIVLINTGLCILVLQFNKYAFLFATIFSINPLVWIINGIYLKNRWNHPRVNAARINRTMPSRAASSCKMPDGRREPH